MGEFNAQKPVNWKRSRTTHKGIKKVVLLRAFTVGARVQFLAGEQKVLKATQHTLPPNKKVKKESSPGKWKAVENYGYYFNYYYNY